MQTNSIYKITNLINNKPYIGQTWRTVKIRFIEHKRPSEKHCIRLWHAFNKYGRENFKIEIIAICSDQNTADYLETFYINDFNSIKNGYNLVGGGSSGLKSDETKKRMSESRKGMKFSDSHIKSMSDCRKGHTHSLETKKKMSIKHSKLSLNDIENIIKLYSSDKYTQKEISIMYNIDTSHISRIINNKARKYNV